MKVTLKYFVLFLIATASSSIISAQLTPCSGGSASGYPCDGFDLVSHLTIDELNGTNTASDIWGWINPDTGVEFAIICLDNGTAFVSLCDPENPMMIGHLATHTSTILWRDVKVYQNHAYIVSEAEGHGMQVFDLMQLPSTTSTPIAFEETAHYDQFGSAHNIVINETTGYAYPVGTSTFSGGPVFLNIQDPVNPILEGGFDADGYTHDAQILVYNGPDTEHIGMEICIASNANTLTIADFTDKTDPELLSMATYEDVNYTHQGWLTEDHRYYLMNDEQDEIFGEQDFTRTLIWDLQDLDAPIVIGEYLAESGAIDHNLYIKDNKAYLANYNSGLRVLDLSDIANANLTEIGYFDVHPPEDEVGFNGSWSVYPYFESDLIIISSIELGLFVVKASENDLAEVNCIPTSIAEQAIVPIEISPNPVNDQLQIVSPQSSITKMTIFDALGRIKMQERFNGNSSLSINVQGLANGTYHLLINTEEGFVHELLIVQ